MDEQPQVSTPPPIDNTVSVEQSASGRKGLFIVLAIIAVIAIVAIIWALMARSQGKTAPPPVVSTSTSQGQGATPPQEVSVELPVLEDTTGDLDRDGIPDGEEAERGTSDTDFDSDGDGLSDETEITIWNTDPQRADTDGDGFADGVEIFNGYNPNGEG